MPLSLILLLKPNSDMPDENLGRQAQAWFLKRLSSIAPSLAQELHDSSGQKPYTVSCTPNLHHWFFHGRRYTGDVCLRITLLNDSLEEVVSNGFLKKLPDSLSLWWVKLNIEGYTFQAEDHPWAGTHTYADIIRFGQESGDDQLVRFEFSSPTAFRSQGIDIPLPVPAHVFRSLWLKWNSFAPEPLQIKEIMNQFVEDCVVVQEIRNLNTVKWKFADGARGAATGFTGEVAYFLLPKNHCGDWAPLWEGSAQILQSLAAFSFYCGTGHHTTIGLGQTRPILPNS